ncbi:MAG: D-alanine--D-alanine ligase [Gammaproteobacteria bacterium]|jgi:hypothetical protein|nr:D-alanine--D-alanine ligase [Gammaproteobacteria bacterium]|tara:strand:- start:2231 stop:3307 length:1077 start_codon:yes stop_codon:yes gene_type:complete
MPALDLSGKSTSFFEFWPSWLMYLPVVILWLLLALRYRSLSLPLLANPGIPLSGMVGVPKSAVFDLAGEEARKWILPWLEYQVSEAAIAEQCQIVEDLIDKAGLQIPIVGKPNIGCRGAGVQLIQTPAELKDYLQQFPVTGVIQFQSLADWDAEAGVFYVRYPGQPSGEITSMTLKYTPYVLGDGEHTLGELVRSDPRAGELIHLYKSRHAENWDKIIPAGEPFRLVFSASHCRGAIFRDARTLISEDLLRRLDSIFDDIPEFYYGRLDIKFSDVETLRKGEKFAIIEINGASSESISIWDRNAGFFAAVATLMKQYRTLFKLGQANRKRGYNPPGVAALYKAWRYEAKLVRIYPEND